MRTYNKSFLIAVVALLVGFTAGMSLAQTVDDSVPASSKLRVGEYRDMTWYRRVKLESAAFVNPKLLKTSATAYKYRLSDVLNAGKGADAAALLADGKIAFGVKFGSTKGMKVAGMKQWANTDGALAVWHSFGSLVGNDFLVSGKLTTIKKPPSLSEARVFLVSDKKLLSGVKNSGKIVSWLAVKKVAPCDPCKLSPSNMKPSDWKAWKYLLERDNENNKKLN